jgi:glucose-1-phosphate thymidylyltransferase
MTDKKFKGIILAGGSGTRLYPMTALYSKQLVTVYDKPMIYYPLSTLMMADIQDILIISDEKTLGLYERLFHDGRHLGMSISYAVQDAPNGIAEAFIIGEAFIGDDNAVLILGDNLFYGYLDFLRKAVATNDGATVFGYYVKDPTKYGVVELDQSGNAISVEEKPADPKSNYAVVGLYVFDRNVAQMARAVEPSDRGELEITGVIEAYLREKRLKVVRLGRGVAWLDSGNPKSLLEASSFIATIEERQGLKIGCIEEIALRRGFIDFEHFKKIRDELPHCQYREYLSIVENEFKLISKP